MNLSDRSRRLPFLDLLRGIAVILVLGRHLIWTSQGSGENPVFDLWHRCGWVGVDLFFVLSGFLISSLVFSEIERTRDFRGKRFLARRALKIFPSFYLFLGANLLISWFLFPSEISVRRLLGELFSVQNYVGGLHTHTWTLGVEEHFYLGLILFVCFAIRKWGASWLKTNAFAKLLFLIIALCAVSRFFFMWKFPEKPVWIFSHTHNRADSLAIGVLLAWLFWTKESVQVWSRKNCWVLIGFGVAALSTTLFFPFLNFIEWTVIWYPLIAAGGAALVAGGTAKDLTPPSLLKPVVWIGLYSYTIYLWHFPIERLVRIFLFGGTIESDELITYALVYTFLSCMVGYLSSALLEQPVLKLRERLFPRDTRHKAIAR